ncbi:hypothetical protein ACWEOW_25080 [Monashia sp. NPDC004114]
MHTGTPTQRDTTPHGTPVTGAPATGARGIGAPGTGGPRSGESGGPDPASGRWQAPGPCHAPDPGDAAGRDGGDPAGLVGTLGSMLATMQHALRVSPWSLSETDIGQALGQAQQLRALADTLTAVLAAEADTRGLGTTDGLSRPDWLRTMAPDLDPATAPALARVAAAMRPDQPRWAALATGVSTGRVSTSQAALILRLHDDLSPGRGPRAPGRHHRCDARLLRRAHRARAGPARRARPRLAHTPRRARRQRHRHAARARPDPDPGHHHLDRESPRVWWRV